MAPSQKANYKTYEAQARMVRAIVAAHPEVRWNYKAICEMYGSDITEHSVNHRFRPIKAQAKLLQRAVKQGQDPKNISLDVAADMKDIAKYFGESTADGIQFQFRAIKKDASAMKVAANNGHHPAQAINLGLGGGSSSAATTPAKPTPTKSSRASSGKSTSRRTTKVKLERPDTDDEGLFGSGAEDADADDNDEMENDEDDDYASFETPSKHPRDRVRSGRVTKLTPASKANNNGASTAATPSSSGGRASSRATAAAANAKLSAQAAAANQVMDLTGSESEVETPTNAHSAPSASLPISGYAAAGSMYAASARSAGVNASPSTSIDRRASDMASQQHQHQHRAGHAGQSLFGSPSPAAANGGATKSHQLPIGQTSYFAQAFPGADADRYAGVFMGTDADEATAYNHFFDGEF